jgi:hypothetical protein
MNYEDMFSDGSTIEVVIDGADTTETFTVEFENGSTIKAHHAYGGGGYGTTTGDDSEDAESAVSRLARKDDDDTDEHYECRQCGCQRSVDDYKRETRAWCDSEECDDIMWHERLDSHPNS